MIEYSVTINGKTASAKFKDVDELLASAKKTKVIDKMDDATKALNQMILDNAEGYADELEKEKKNEPKKIATTIKEKVRTPLSENGDTGPKSLEADKLYNDYQDKMRAASKALRVYEDALLEINTDYEKEKEALAKKYNAKIDEAKKPYIDAKAALDKANEAYTKAHKKENHSMYDGLFDYWVNNLLDLF